MRITAYRTLDGVKRVLRYTKSTISKGITYHGAHVLNGVGYSDSEWGGCAETRKSREGFLFLFGSGPVSWRSKKQSTVATSSCEAEYVAAFAAAKESVWLPNMPAEMMGKLSPQPLTIYVDNQGAISLSQRSTISNRSKLIEIRLHYLMDAVAQKKVYLEYIPSHQQLADALTKPLGRISFQKMVESTGICSNTSKESLVQGGVLIADRHPDSHSEG